MKKRHYMLLFSLLFTVVFFLAACTEDAGSGSSDGASDDTSNEEGTEEGARSDDGEKTLVFGRGNDSLQLDPSKVTDGESIYVTNQIFDPLVRYKEESTEVKPALATEWDTSDDGLVWTFQLRDDVTFHDGTDFTAEDVVYNFERWTTSGDFSYYAYMFGSTEEDMGGDY